MKNSLGLKIIFYFLLIAVAVAAGMLIERKAIQTNINNEQPSALVNANSPATASNAPANQPLNQPAIPTPQKPVPQKPTCIITVDGQKYDVQSLRSTHTGGDVFQCGTDMSAVFHGQHGNNLRLIQRYLVP